MRIISGTHKGRKINPPSNLPVRPTTDFAKESLFNILRNQFSFPNCNALDLFSGTGSISYEFASRECDEIIAVENDALCYDFIKKSIDHYSFEKLQVVKSNVFAFLNFCKKPFDIIFADPPYDSKGIETIPDLVWKKQLIKENGILVIEHSASLNFEKYDHFYEVRKYGKVHFSFFSLNKIKPEQIYFT